MACMKRAMFSILGVTLTTEQWSDEQRWTLLLTRLLRRRLGGKWLPGLPAEAAQLLSG